jgi:hypothetical protein
MAEGTPFTDCNVVTYRCSPRPPRLDAEGEHRTGNDEGHA